MDYTFSVAPSATLCDRIVTGDVTHERNDYPRRQLAGEDVQRCADASAVQLLARDGEAVSVAQLCPYCFDAVRQPGWPSLADVRSSEHPLAFPPTTPPMEEA